MGRPGFVHEVDRSTPPVLFWRGENFSLEKLPADRHASAEKFASALGDGAAAVRPVSGARAAAARAGRPSTVRRALPWIGGLAAGALVGVFGATLFIAGVGFADDIKSIPVVPRLSLQALQWWVRRRVQPSRVKQPQQRGQLPSLARWLAPQR